jgi:hypothetical protein
MRWAEDPPIPRRHHLLRASFATGGGCARRALERIGYTPLNGPLERPLKVVTQRPNEARPLS